MPQRQGKRNGLRTNATVRYNEFERKATKGAFIMNKSDGIVLSLSKSQRWELLNDVENELPVRKTIPMNMQSNSKVSPYGQSFPGGPFVDYDRARHFQKINDKIDDTKLEEEESINSWIDLPFKNGEYPLKRQLYKKHATPCKACLRAGGVIVFRGRGDKSSGKTKGMKSYQRKEWRDEFNL